MMLSGLGTGCSPLSRCVLKRTIFPFSWLIFLSSPILSLAFAHTPLGSFSDTLLNCPSWTHFSWSQTLRPWRAEIIFTMINLFYCIDPESGNLWLQIAWYMIKLGLSEFISDCFQYFSWVCGGLIISHSLFHPVSSLESLLISIARGKKI